MPIRGGFNYKGKDRFFSDVFYTAVSGSGDINLELDAKLVNSDISGSGSIRLSGKAGSYDASITGSGEIDAFGMEARNATITITGSGNCSVKVLEIMRTRITGSGDVRYRGYPRISNKITGSGSVEDRN